MKKAFFPLYVISIFWVISCQPTKRIADASCPEYKIEWFERGDISASGIAIMPVLGNEGLDQYCRQMDSEITRSMSAKFGKDIVKSPYDVISILKDVGFDDEYERTITLFRTSGVFTKEDLFQIGEALAVEYLLSIRLLEYTQIDNYKRTLKYCRELYIHSQVWNTKLGEVVWEGKGGYAALEGEDIDLVRKSAEGISIIVGNDINDGPCESSKIIYNSIKWGTAKGVIIVLIVPPLLIFGTILLLLSGMSG